MAACSLLRKQGFCEGLKDQSLNVVRFVLKTVTQPVFLCHLVSRQAEGVGGDQELHYSVSGQRRLPDQHTRQQCVADARHPGVAAPPHGVIHQPHLTG